MTRGIHSYTSDDTCLKMGLKISLCLAFSSVVFALSIPHWNRCTPTNRTPFCERLHKENTVTPKLLDNKTRM